jgi:hypothetical protein
VETAVALFFSSSHGPAAVSDPDSPIAQLRAILGPSLTTSQASSLLRICNDSVQQAIDLFYARQGNNSS